MTDTSAMPSPWPFTSLVERAGALPHSKHSNYSAFEKQLVSLAKDMANEIERLRASHDALLEALEGLDPHIDAIVCYASNMGEHEPNRLAHNARAAIAKATDTKGT